MILGLSDTEKKFKTAMDTAGLSCMSKPKRIPPVLQSAIMA